MRAPPRVTTQPIRRPGDRLQRPAIINPEDLKDLDELDNDCEDGWAGEFSFWALTSDICVGKSMKTGQNLTFTLICLL